MKSTAAVEVEVLPKGGADTVVKNFKQQLKEAKNEAQQMVITFGEFSNEALAAQKKVAELSDKMEDFNDRVKALNPDKFAKVQTVVNGVASGFAAAQGAMALFGNESEDLQKTLVKVQGAMALSQGLEGLGKIQQQFQTLAKDGVQALIQSFSTLKGAIISTGIGALVVALGYAIANFDKLVPKTKTLAENLNLTDEELKSVSETTAKQTTNVNQLVNAVTDHNRSEKDRRESLKKLKEQYPNYFNNLTNDINDTKTLTAQKDKLIETLIREARVRASQDQIEKIAAKNIGQRMKLNSDLIKAEKDLAVAYKETEGVQFKANKNLKDFVIPGDEEFNATIKEQPEILEKSRNALAKRLQAQTKLSDIQFKINGLNRQEVKDSEVFTKIIGDETVAIEKNGGASEVKTEKTIKNAKNELKTLQEKNEALRKLDEANATEGLDAITTQYANNLSRIKEAEAQEVKQKGLTEEQKNEITAKYSALSTANEVLRLKEVDVFTKAAQEKAFTNQLEATNNFYIDKENLVKEKLNKGAITEKEFNDEIDKLEVARLNKLLQVTKDAGKSTVDIQKQIADKQTEIHNKKISQSDKEIAKAKEVRDAQIKAANDYLSALTTFNDAENEQSKNAFDMRMEQLKQQGYTEEEITNMKDAELQKQDDRMRQSFELNKVAQIAAALMNTYLGVTSALAILPTQQLYPGQRFIEAGAALAMGLANVYKIQQTQYKSAMPTGGAAGGGAGSRQNGQGQMQSFAPRMSTLNTNDALTQNRKVFVTEGDITRTQRRVSNNQAISVVE
jgi:hypothetical protein